MGNTKRDSEHASDSGTGHRLRVVANRLFDGNQSELARSLGMKPPSFAKYFDGRRQPGAVVLKRLAKLGVNVNWMLTGRGRVKVGTEANGTPSARDTDSIEERASSDASPRVIREIPLMTLRQDDQGAVRLVESGFTDRIRECTIREDYGVEPERLRDFHVGSETTIERIRADERIRGAVVERSCSSNGSHCLLRGPDSLLIRRVRLRKDKVILGAEGTDRDRRTVDFERWKRDYEPIARVLEVRRPL